MRHSRIITPLIVLTGISCALLLGQSQRLTVEREGEFVHFSAPQMHVLEGKPLEQLRNGAAVTYVFELTLTSDQKSAPVVHLLERFIVSFDLWEEKFKVVQVDAPGRSASLMSAANAEAWCMDGLRAKLPALSPEEALTIRLECWTAANEDEIGNGSSSTLTLAGLVDVFSRKSRNPPPRWLAVTGPLRLSEIKERKKQKSGHELPGAAFRPQPKFL